jgi:hypothetical protein
MRKRKERIERMKRGILPEESKELYKMENSKSKELRPY